MATALGPLCLLSSRSRVRVALGALPAELLTACVQALTSQLPGPRAAQDGPGLVAEPLDADDEYEVIWRIDQESDESFVVSAEMQGTQ